MRCKQVQSRLLAQAHPHRPPPDELNSHLDGCESCRVFFGRLREAESGLARLPVPDSSHAKAQFLLQFCVTPSKPTPAPKKSAPLPWRAPVGLIAASLLLAGGLALTL